MNQITTCDWLPERASLSYTVRSGFLAWSRKIIDHFLVFYPIITIIGSLKGLVNFSTDRMVIELTKISKLLFKTIEEL